MLLLGEDEKLDEDPGILLEDDAEEVVIAVLELDAVEIEVLVEVVEELELEETNAGFS